MIPGKKNDEVSSKDIANLLDSSGWMREADRNTISQFSTYLTLHTLEPDTELIKEGSQEAFMAIVVEGKLAVKKKDARDKDQLICTLGKGKSVGEISLVDKYPSSATVAAVSETSVLVLSETQFNSLCADRSSIGVLFLLKLARSLCANLRRTSGQLVDYLGEV